MAKRKRGSRRSNYQLIYLVAAALIVSVLLLTAFEISNRVMPSNYTKSTIMPHLSSTKQNFSAVQDIYQYDGGINHTYFVGVNLKPLNIDVNSAIIGTPTIYRGDLLVTTMGNLTFLDKFQYDRTNGSVTAINLSTGRIVWRTYFPDQIMTQPIAYRNMIFVGMGNNAEVPNISDRNNGNGIFGLNFSTGKVSWGMKTLGPDMTTPGIYNGLLIEPNIGYFYIVKASSGLVEKSFPTNLPDTLSSPLIYGNNAYFGAGYVNTVNTKIYPTTIHRFSFFDYNITSGDISWQDNFSMAGGGINDVVPVVYRNLVITAYLDNSTYANPIVVGLNRFNGSEVWSLNETAALNSVKQSNPEYANAGYNFTENSISPMVLYNGTVFADSNYLGVLFAINATTGKVIWAFNTGQNEGAPNVFYGKYVIDMNDGGDLFVLGIRNGTLVNELQTGMPHLAAQPVITNNYALIAGMDGRVLYFNLDNITGRA
ncbi:MAG: PQQ-binding-like beta-propeller repeat protein [Candidatus Marsarchaeota archaeon]|nr:PQQ-binding-like beta-propeller repeat protein [Candidatus Marsarchaeota archaeon]MCL5431032.1 PQQ-binding-like beta-propeller repeat protein [Candidatus Marsarchaeota archaeon]